MSDADRIVITGIGLASPNGSNLREFRLGLNPRQPDAQCSELQKALGATDPSECGSLTITQLLR